MTENCIVGVNTRNELISALLTQEEFRVLEKLCESTGHDYAEVIGKALIVYDRLMEFVGE